LTGDYVNFHDYQRINGWMDSDNRTVLWLLALISLSRDWETTAELSNQSDAERIAQIKGVKPITCAAHIRRL
jgi:hypothetical protein